MKNKYILQMQVKLWPITILIESGLMACLMYYNQIENILIQSHQLDQDAISRHNLSIKEMFANMNIDLFQCILVG